jgi:hypothetical protein
MHTVKRGLAFIENGNSFAVAGVTSKVAQFGFDPRHCEEAGKS